MVALSARHEDRFREAQPAVGAGSAVGVERVARSGPAVTEEVSLGVHFGSQYVCDGLVVGGVVRRRIVVCVGGEVVQVRRMQGLSLVMWRIMIESGGHI